MKQMIKGLGAAAFLTGALLLSSAASANFISYWFDYDGPGGDAAIEVGEFLDYTGAVYAENTYTGATSFNLEQWGYAQIVGSDSVFNAALGAAGVVATYEGSGTGDLATGSTSFVDGTLNLYTGGFGGTLIASFDIIGGGAQIVELTGAPDGASGLDAVATYFAPGYFFFDAALTQDFADLDLTEDFIFGFATSDLTLTVNQTALNNQHALLDLAFPGNDFGNPNQVDEFGRLVQLTSGANGQFRLTEVPEPATVALFGLGLVGLGMAMRRRKQG